MQKKLLVDLLNREFRINETNDISLNGLQCDNSKDDIKKIAFAVDACYDTIIKAARIKADMLFVHHGLFWGKPLAVTGTHYNRIKALFDNNIALFAVHLPLDMHPVLGNNAQMAKVLGLKNIQEFGEYHNIKIGIKGELDRPLGTKECAALLGFTISDDLKIQNFGNTKNKTIAIISGGAANDVTQAVAENIDLYITGEHSHTAFHIAEEEKINVISGGHYKSEVFGVRAVCEYLKKQGIEGIFIDSPTGM